MRRSGGRYFVYGDTEKVVVARFKGPLVRADLPILSAWPGYRGLTRPQVGEVWGKLTGIEDVVKDGLALETPDLEGSGRRRGWVWDRKFEREIAVSATSPNMRGYERIRVIAVTVQPKHRRTI